MARQLLAVIVCFLVFLGTTHAYSEKSVLYETFDEGWESRWVHSKNQKYDGKFKVGVDKETENSALQVPEKSKHYGLTSLLKRPVDPSEGLVLQYDVKFADGITCGGAYVKLLTQNDGFTAEDLTNETPYSIMFGPDKCGGPGKVHLILKHRSPKTGELEEKHLSQAPTPVTDDKTHIYTLVLTDDNRYEILVDGEEKTSGSLFEKFEPPINPPKEIPDPDDVKPKDWVDEAKIPDPAAKKPGDWDDRTDIEDEDAVKPKDWEDDEPLVIEDPDAVKPEDWDDEEDGEWTRPEITNPKCSVGCGEWKRPTKRNPAYKGAWQPPLIDNPAYKGEWIQKNIPNKNHYEDKAPLKSIGKIGAIAFEIWTVDSGYLFDNVMITDDADVAADFRENEGKAKQDKEATLAKEKEASDDSATSDPLVRKLVDLFDRPALLPYKHHFDPVLRFLRTRPWVAYALLCLVPLPLLLLLRKGKKTQDPRAVDKKQDVTHRDDDEVVAEEPVSAPIPVTREKIIAEIDEEPEEINGDEDSRMRLRKTRRKV